MERRIYSGGFTPSELATHLVEHFDPQENVQAQDIGRDGAHLVQIGRGDVPRDLRHAVTVAITVAPDGGDGVAVTLGQQQWLTPQMGTWGAACIAIGALITPWALFALIWPVSELVGATTLPRDIWNEVDIFAASNGGNLARTEELTHPHTL